MSKEISFEERNLKYRAIAEKKIIYKENPYKVLKKPNRAK